MKKVATLIIVLFFALCSLIACSNGTYDKGFADGYDAGYRAASNKYQSTPETTPTTTPTTTPATTPKAPVITGDPEADAILAKYGITQIGGSESTTPTSGSSEADKFTDKWNSGPTSYTPPVSGTILSGKEYYDSEITVTADSSSHYVVSLRNSRGIERTSFFVRSGDTVTIGVPAEYLYVYFASGTVWYGYGEGLMFGKETVYSKDDDLLDFTNYTYEYTLYPVYNGNFSQTPCDAADFFG